MQVLHAPLQAQVALYVQKAKAAGFGPPGAVPKGPPLPPPQVPKAFAQPQAVNVELGSHPDALERPKLTHDRRWSSWREGAVGLAALIWADMRIEMEELKLTALTEEMKKILAEQLGQEAVVSILAPLGSNPSFFCSLELA